MSKKRPQSVKRKATSSDEEQRRKGRISQADVPSFTLAQAVRVPRAIVEYGGQPTRPLRIAEALEMSITSSQFRMLCGASIAYGLTEGGYNAAQIALTPLGQRMTAHTEGNDQAALREACLRPQAINNFLTRYNNRRLPPDNIAYNVLEEMGVPREKAARTLSIILENARHVGFLREIKGQQYVDLDTADTATAGQGDQADANQLTEDEGTADLSTVSAEAEITMPASSAQTATAPAQANQPSADNNRVFISHGKNKEIVAQLKELLSFGKFEPVVSVEKETVSKPVPDKVMEDMRSCFAAIIHVGQEMKMMDSEGKEHIVLNQNVLIEIGAAMALYGGKFILLVETGATVPSNLQGLYQVRYEGEKLDYDATIKLLKAFNDFRS